MSWLALAHKEKRSLKRNSECGTLPLMVVGLTSLIDCLCFEEIYGRHYKPLILMDNEMDFPNTKKNQPPSVIFELQELQEGKMTRTM